MFYICVGCGFLFSRVGEVTGCPFCGGDRIRSAAGEEEKKLRSLLEQNETGSNKKE